MRLVLFLNDGTKMTVENVAYFSEIDETKLFEVNPLGINRKIFEEPRKNKKQEQTRQIILEAFAEVDKNPEKYAGAFELFVPDKLDWMFKTPRWVYKDAIDFGGDMADWVEQALGWAQQISNGESWETMCNEPDTAKWYRMIKWKNGCARQVGDSNMVNKGKKYYSPTYIDNQDFSLDDNTTFLGHIVPLVVIKK